MTNIGRKTGQLIERQLFKGKIILLLGARRVGKTFLCKELISRHKGVYYNCELNETKDLLATQSRVALSNLVGKSKLVVFDEAQDIPDIGKKLKVFHDEFPDVQIIATGSSSFDLIHKTSEPLTGRSRTYQLYPLSFAELVEHDTLSNAHGQLENILRFGLYPEVFNHSVDQKIEELENIASNYLFKDMLLYGDLRRPDIILEILKLIAFQIGGELSLNEISNKSNTSVHTVKRYLDLLEKSFVIFSLSGFSRNLRKEIGKSKKYYFFDLGIRNALIRNFTPINSRNDIGMLWENFCISERIKLNAYNRNFKNYYFWRTYDQQEIDFLEEYEGRLSGFEFKFDSEKISKSLIFLNTYPESSIKLVNRKSYFDFVLDGGNQE